MNKKILAACLIIIMAATIGILSLCMIGTFEPKALAFTSLEVCIINCAVTAAYHSTDPDVRLILFDMCMTAEC